jgi:hypothetical protein
MSKVGNHIQLIAENFLNQAAKVEPGELISKEIILTAFADQLFKMANRVEALNRKEAKICQ